MTNALDLALANAAANAPQGEELHLKNLDAIANPEREEVILHQYDPNRVVVPEPPQYNPKDVAFNQPLTAFQQQALDYQLRMQTEYKQKLLEPDHSDISYISIDFKLNSLTSAAELTRLRLDALADMITAISTTITTAAQSMPSEPNLKHRSLDEWGDSTLLNELVERENDLMPFYYELLKRIGSPELQSLVMSSMQGKNASMVTLAQLCAAMGSMSTQAESAKSKAQDPNGFVHIYGQGYVDPRTVPPMRHDGTTDTVWTGPNFGQATEEYIRQTNNRIGS